MKRWATDIKASRNGFTIVELLIVIVVIAILAAITVVAYIGIQTRASETALQADLSAIAKKIEIYKVNTGSYPSDWRVQTTSDPLYKISVNYSVYATSPTVAKNLFYCTVNGQTAYALGGTAPSGKRFYMTSSSPLQEYTGTPAWTIVNSDTICNGMISGAYAGGWVGYDSSASPVWRW